jgi:isopentenyl-diphosphate Delta-isomerase
VRTSRKMEHVAEALRLGQFGLQGLSDLKFVHNGLPESSLQHISLQSSIGGLIKLSSPILINAMTGGAHETEKINRELAVVAREKGLAMAVGSQMAAIRDNAVASTYKVVRKVNPHGLVFANLGSEATPQQAAQAVEMIEGDALQIHLNAMQELIMPEGDRSFEGAGERIAAIIDHVQVPVIVKEVGFGILRETADRLKTLGVSIVDVGGSGGTNFAAIENARRDIPLDWLNDWGASTVVALLETLTIYPRGSVIASGGIRSPLDVVKALSLGASAVGMAGSLLRILQTEGTEAVMRFVDDIHTGVGLVMTALGADSIERLWEKPLVVSGETADWCRARGVDTYEYARRGSRSIF